MEFIEHQIGEKVEIDGNNYIVEAISKYCNSICDKCSFYNKDTYKRVKACSNLKCSKFERQDKTDIFYKKI